MQNKLDLVLTHCVLRCDGAVVGCCGGGRQEGDHDHHADHGRADHERADHQDGRRVLWTGGEQEPGSSLL